MTTRKAKLMIYCPKEKTNILFNKCTKACKHQIYSSLSSYSIECDNEEGDQ